MNEYPESLTTEDALKLLVNAVERLQFEMGGVESTKNCTGLIGKWDNEHPTFFYLNRTLRWSKVVLASKADKG